VGALVEACVQRCWCGSGEDDDTATEKGATSSQKISWLRIALGGQRDRTRCSPAIAESTTTHVRGGERGNGEKLKYTTHGESPTVRC
jgi:hypothetical protein